MADKDEIRSAILEAAIDRFLHYGYGKTTMSEIARDCNMSTGNLYRFFESKLDIAEAMAHKADKENQALLAAVARRPGVGAEERLRDMLFSALRKTYAELEEDPNIFEIAQIISKERPQYANEKLAQERAFLSEVLSSGVAAGDFDIDDVVFAAEMIQSVLCCICFIPFTQGCYINASQLKHI